MSSISVLSSAWTNQSHQRVMKYPLAKARSKDVPRLGIADLEVKTAADLDRAVEDLPAQLRQLIVEPVEKRGDVGASPLSPNCLEGSSSQVPQVSDFNQIDPGPFHVGSRPSFSTPLSALSISRKLAPNFAERACPTPSIRSRAAIDCTRRRTISASCSLVNRA